MWQIHPIDGHIGLKCLIKIDLSECSIQIGRLIYCGRRIIVFIGE